jgi:hypothetical protein
MYHTGMARIAKKQATSSATVWKHEGFDEAQIVTMITDAPGGLRRKRDIDREGGLGEFVCHHVRLWVDTNASTRRTSIHKRLSTERWLIEVLSLGLFSKNGEIGVSRIPEDALDVWPLVGGSAWVAVWRKHFCGQKATQEPAAVSSRDPPGTSYRAAGTLNRAVEVVAPPRPHFSTCKKWRKMNETNWSQNTTSINQKTNNGNKRHHPHRGSRKPSKHSFFTSFFHPQNHPQNTGFSTRRNPPRQKWAPIMWRYIGKSDILDRRISTRVSRGHPIHKISVFAI